MKLDYQQLSDLAEHLNNINDNVNTEFSVDRNPLGLIKINQGGELQFSMEEEVSLDELKIFWKDYCRKNELIFDESLFIETPSPSPNPIHVQPEIKQQDFTENNNVGEEKERNFQQENNFYTTDFTIEGVEFEGEDSYDEKEILNMTNFSQNQAHLNGQLNRYSVLNTPFLDTHHNNNEESECCCIIQ
ncbi:hypothetical protein [Piscirickettsia salmonis]|uniref:hypothetical protein n=1 Tax=Piscirickettsia salmonis TaxID=1238 RepID=UPI0007C97803|nr:hypothetical protein A0O36_02003 [Piscirickettsiaceae bacterium NZ-RLO1]